jgi:hypothetical protein
VLSRPDRPCAAVRRPKCAAASAFNKKFLKVT